MVELWDWELEGIKYPGMTELYISTNDMQNWRLQFRYGKPKRIRLEKRITTEELFDSTINCLCSWYKIGITNV
ncbi:hypothetical protein P4679_24860 [Priestia megaterium]|uniref:hypothetical protein n=1 Tax=Priestia megaterium TaxID=1404 RepID=UPI002E217FC1|nr:hypothetical protein [Priestia megaterium]